MAKRKQTKHQRQMQQRKAASQQEAKKVRGSLLRERNALVDKWDKYIKGNPLAELPEGAYDSDISVRQLKEQIADLRGQLLEEQQNILGAIGSETPRGEADRLRIKAALVGASPEEEERLKALLDNIHAKKEAGESVNDLYAEVFKASDYVVTKQIEKETETGKGSSYTPF